MEGLNKSQSKTTKIKTMKTSIKDIMSVLKNDGRFQGNQKQLAAINTAVGQAKGDKSNLIAFSKEVQALIS